MDSRRIAGLLLLLTAFTAPAQPQEVEVEKDPNVRQDLRILVHAVEEGLQDSTLQERYLLHWVDAPQVMFLGLRELLQDDVSPERRAHALPRLRRYVGLEPGSAPLTRLARARCDRSESRAVSDPGANSPGAAGPRGRVPVPETRARHAGGSAVGFGSH
jgi:hypothetical protein